MNESLDIVTIGESLIELSSNVSLKQAATLDKYYGGDTLATAVTASRLGSKVGYITRVGCDYFKEFLLDSWQSEGLDISQVKLTSDTNGLYLLARPEGEPKEFSYYRKKTAATKLSIDDISENYIADSKIFYTTGFTQALSLSDRKGEPKEFSYYRKKTAATKLSIDDISENYIADSKIFYTTGFTQALSLSVKEAVKKGFELAQKNSVITAYDPNFTSRLETPTEARELFDDIMPYIKILFLNSVNDIENLFEISSIEKAIKDLWDMGIQTVVIKSPNNKGVYTGYNGDIVFNKYLKLDIVDTTCSGDAFNGGFLHGIASGMTPFEASKLAIVVSGLQATKIGAIKSIPTKKEVYEEYEKM